MSSSEFRMPSLGPDMESGTLVEWRVKPGDVVKRGDVVALVETDKGVIDVETFSSGTVTQLLVAAGAHVPVGAVLAQLQDGEERGAAPTPTAHEAAAPARVERAASAPAPAPAHHEPRSRASPAARARAHALGVDLASVQGTGPHGVVTLEDVLKHAQAAPAAATAAPASAPAPDMRRIIAKAMSRSKREIPHYYLCLTCDFTKATAWLQQHNAAAQIEDRLSPAALFIKATALAARAQNDFNGFYQDDEFAPSANVHVGMAIAMRGGRLAAPAILDADRKPLTTVMHELRDLTARARAGHMRALELSAPTITVTSLAEDGVDFIVPAIYPPQVAIVGFGSVVERPWAINGAMRAAPVVAISLAADHRVTDGRAGARFLARIRDALQSPEQL